MSLDTLYGTSTADSFAALVDISGVIPGTTATILEHDCEDGSTWVQVAWDAPAAHVGSYRLECRPGWVHCTSLNIEPAFREHGILDHLTVSLLGWLADHGVVAHTAVAGTSHSQHILERVGFHWQQTPATDGEVFAMRCDQPDRANEYVAWVSDGRPADTEPAWLKALPAEPPALF